MPNISNSKNIFYNPSFIAGGDLHIGDKIYHIHQDFEQTILFLTIERVILKKNDNSNKIRIETNEYQATIAIKSKHVEGEMLLKEPIQISLTNRLLRKINQFSRRRRRRRRTAGSDSRFIPLLSPFNLHIEESQIAKELFESIITGDIKEVCEDFILLLHKGKIEELILVVQSTESEILNLPFELLQNEMGQYWALQNDSFCIAHTTEKEIGQFSMQGKTAIGAPLRILFITSLPEDLPDNGKFLELEKEEQKLIESIAVLESNQRVVVEFLDGAALKNIDEALENGKHHVVHISGHGAHLDQQKNGILYLEDLDGNTHEVSGEELGKILNKHKSSIKLVFLSACETARAEEDGVIGGLMKTSGIPAIIGMRYPVTDVAAILFTAQFYKHLCDNKSLTTALFHARESVIQHERAIREAQKDKILPSEWFTPFLYLNQYLGSFIDTDKAISIPAHFYKKSSLLKRKHSKLIGEGFIGRRRYIAQLNQYFKKREPVCIHGLGGIGKTTLAERFAVNYRNKQYQLIQFDKGSLTEYEIIEKIAQKAYSHLKKDEDLVEMLKYQLNTDKSPLDKVQLLIDNFLARPEVKTILFIDNFEDNLVGDPKRDSNSDVKSISLTNFHKIKSESLKVCLQYLLKNIPKNCLFLVTCRYTITELPLKFLQLGRMPFPEVYRLFNASEKLRQISFDERLMIFNYFGGYPKAFEKLLEYMENTENIWGEIELILPKMVDELIYRDLFLDRIWKLLKENDKNLLCKVSIFKEETNLEHIFHTYRYIEFTFSNGIQNLVNCGLIQVKEKKIHISNIIRNFVANTKEFKENRGAWNQNAIHYFNNFYKNKENIDYLFIKRWHLLVEEEFDSAGLITIDISEKYQIEGMYEHGIKILKDSLNFPFSDEIRGRLIGNLGIQYKSLRKFDLALRHFFDSLEVFRRKSQKKQSILLHYNIGTTYFENGNHYESEKWLKKCYDLAKKLPDANLIVASKIAMANLYEKEGQYNKAEFILEQSLKIAKNNNYEEGIIISLGEYGVVSYKNNKLKQAIIALEELINLSKNDKYKRWLGNAKKELGIICIKIEKFDKALKLFEVAKDIFLEINFVDGLGNCFHQMGLIKQIQGNSQLARQYYVKACNRFIETNNLLSYSLSFFQLGNLDMMENELYEALKKYEYCLPIFRQFNHKDSEAVCLFNIGNIKIGMKLFEIALDYLFASMNIFETMDGTEYEVQDIRASIIEIGRFFDLNNYLNNKKLI